MITNTPTTGREMEQAHAGDEAYEQFVRPHIHPEDLGKFVAVDVLTGEFEIEASGLTALQRLHARVPDAKAWLVRIGQRHAHRFGRRAV